MAKKKTEDAVLDTGQKQVATDRQKVIKAQIKVQLDLIDARIEQMNKQRDSMQEQYDKM